MLLSSNAFKFAGQRTGYTKNARAGCRDSSIWRHCSCSITNRISLAGSLLNFRKFSHLEKTRHFSSAAAEVRNLGCANQFVRRRLSMIGIAQNRSLTASRVVSSTGRVISPKKWDSLRLQSKSKSIFYLRRISTSTTKEKGSSSAKFQWNLQQSGRRCYTIKSKTSRPSTLRKSRTPIMSVFSQKLLLGITSLVIGGSLIYILNEHSFIQPLPATRLRSDLAAEKRKERAVGKAKDAAAAENTGDLSELPFKDDVEESTAWNSFSENLATLSSVTDFQWASFSDSITSYIIPDWAKVVPGYIQKLQRELSMAPGSLADEIWQEAHDPFINPEIRQSASVRVSAELCDEEKEFLKLRKQVTAVALAKYLGVPEEDVHPEDVPTIAMVGSGGGLRALVAGTGSMLAAYESGLFDCVTYSAGVSGSCWLQALFHSSLGQQKFDKMVDHLKARLGIHIAYPPVALSALNTAPTNKFLLTGFVEKLKGDPNSDFGLVDIYGLLLSARLLVPKGELGVDGRDLKLSNQREYIKRGEFPMPIYTAVRHEIPIIEEASQTEKKTGSVAESTKEKAKREAWFQWFEFTPYELFCEEFSAGIPTWAVGRKFKDGKDIPIDESGLYIPELRLSLLMGVFGSAFCATLSHYYKEVRPLVKGLMGFGSIDDMIEGRNEDLSKLHPIDPASIPNFVYGMQGKLPSTTPQEIYKNEHISLMDAGMSNNLPIYPLLRPGRDVDILIAFDASADIKQDNWLSVADGYARQRGIKGWPIGLGWPKETNSREKTKAQLEDAQAKTAAEAETKVEDAKKHDHENVEGTSQTTQESQNSHSDDLGYCTVWVGSTEERSYTDIDQENSEPPPKTKAAEDWQLMEPNAGIAVIYFPFLANPKVEGVDPVKSEFMSTWNFVYTSEEVDRVVELARENFGEGNERVRRVVRAVWERKRGMREKGERERREKGRRWRGQGDHFT